MKPVSVVCFALFLLASITSANRIVVIGDLHGDLSQGLSLLKASKVVSFQPDYYEKKLVSEAKKSVATGSKMEIPRDQINANMIYNKRGHLMAGSNPDSYHWSAGRGICVILGDAMNVGPDDLDLVRLFMRLDAEAVAAGGKLVYVYGNHEIHNLEGDFSGVHPWSFERSGGREGRKRMFSMATPLGRYLRTRASIFEFDGLIFMHGGLFPLTVETMKKVVRPYHRETVVAEINKAVTKALTSKTGRNKDDPVSELILDADYASNGNKGPLLVHPLKECAKVKEANKMLGDIQAQVVGHTPHDPPVYDFCNGELFALDFHMSQWKGGEGTAFAALEFTRSDNKNFVFSNSSTGKKLPRWKWESTLIIPSEENEAESTQCNIAHGHVSLPVAAALAVLAVVVFEGVLWFLRRKSATATVGTAEEKATLRPDAYENSYGST